MDGITEIRRHASWVKVFFVAIYLRCIQAYNRYYIYAYIH